MTIWQEIFAIVVALFLHEWVKLLPRAFVRKPDLYVGGEEDPYMLRWYILPRNRIFNIYLHKFVRDDDDEAFHDHPWWFVSLMLKGNYYETTPSEWNGLGQVELRWPLSLAFRRASHLHRVTLLRDKEGNPLPCWTLVITGSKCRTWGFQCPTGWVNFRDYLTSKELTGSGCDNITQHDKR